MRWASRPRPPTRQNSGSATSTAPRTSPDSWRPYKVAAAEAAWTSTSPRGSSPTSPTAARPWRRCPRPSCRCLPSPTTSPPPPPRPTPTSRRRPFHPSWPSVQTTRGSTPDSLARRTRPWTSRRSRRWWSPSPRSPSCRTRFTQGRIRAGGRGEAPPFDTRPPRGILAVLTVICIKKSIYEFRSSVCVYNKKIDPLWKIRQNKKCYKILKSRLLSVHKSIWCHEVIVRLDLSNYVSSYLI